MELTGDHVLPVPRERVWSALLDSQTLRAAIPGCEEIAEDGPGAYRVVVVAAVGPVRARFHGRLQQHDLQPPEHYTLSFEGDGGIAGFARGSAEVDLSVPGSEPGHTRLAYRAQAQVGGRLAQIGSRLIDATAARMSAQFFERLTQAITTPAESPGKEDAAAMAPTPAMAPPSSAVIVRDTRGVVTIQMPAWAWAFTVAALVSLLGWLAVH